ncbi:MAG: cytochrome b/b6 domain-containing protein [Candidatus Coatesbacteria bacterium]|nr:MAG: cytochrome b/b6 domain-containing protein [Candidatus Coatesbacteria bacterium]
MTKIRALGLALLTLTLVGAVYAADLSKCDMCHKPAGKPAPAIPGGLYASPHAALGCLSCHVGASQPHREGVATRRCSSCHEEAAAALAASAHGAGAEGAPGCYTCHEAGHGVHSLTCEHLQPTYGPRICAQCHADETDVYLKSAHGRAAAAGIARAPTCDLCHGTAHATEPIATDHQLSDENQPAFCGECHAGKQATPDSPFSIPDPGAALLASVHGEIDPETGLHNAKCSDCHYLHDEQPAWHYASSTHFMNVAETCGACHEHEYELFASSVHGLAAAAGVRDAPTCPDCHGDHGVVAVAEYGTEGRGTRVVATCSSCHYSLALSSKFEIPNDRVQTFETSYHGVVSEGGKTTAADCGSCHGVHDVLPASDPRSSVHPANLERTCGECHIRVTERFVGTTVHDPRVHPRRTPADYVAIIYILMIVVVLGGMVGHNVVDYVAKVREIRRAQRERSKFVTRLRRVERLQHLALILSFAGLGFTGFAIKFPNAFIFSWIVHLEGPYSIRIIVHKVFAVALIVAAVYHVGYMLFTRNGRARFKAIAPRWSDAREGLQTVLHAVGLARRRPEFGEFNYAEKAEYWALVWGTVIMALTGLYIWLDPYIQQFFPYWLYEVLRTIHFYEAILAVSAIVIWHFYHVIFDPHLYPMSFAWLDGKVPEKVLMGERLGYVKRERERSEADGELPEESSSKEDK